MTASFPREQLPPAPACSERLGPGITLLCPVHANPLWALCSQTWAVRVSVIKDAAQRLFINAVRTEQGDRKRPPRPAPRLKCRRLIFTTAALCSRCRDPKERVRFFCCSDAQPCRMTHDGRNGTDVNRGRAQVGLTCTRPANGAPRPSARLLCRRFHWSCAASLRCRREAQLRNYAAERVRGGEKND